jgi:hypothetical protein
MGMVSSGSRLVVEILAREGNDIFCMLYGLAWSPVYRQPFSYLRSEVCWQLDEFTAVSELSILLLSLPIIARSAPRQRLVANGVISS